MRVKTLAVRNLRLYGDEEQTIRLDESKNVTVFLGDNGAGKTSLLYGCTVLLSQFYEHFPECSKRQIIPEDVRNISNRRRADYLHIGMNLGPSSVGSEFMPVNPETQVPSVTVDIYQKGNDTANTPNSVLKGIKDYSLTIKTRIDNGEQVALPVIAYYGTERGQIKPVERRRDFNDVFPRWEIYRPDSLNSATDFRRFFTWFERNEDIERREKINRQDFSYTSPVLNAVRRALNQLFPGFLCNPRVLDSPWRFVMDDISDPANPLEKRIEHMSDGYRITIALVADIASRMAESNPTLDCSGLEDPLLANGVVMIDEIDLHLHPKLQRDILRKLTSIFPNVQFIVSTHSPNVVIGALDLVQVIKLDHGIVDTNINTAQFEKYDISLLLLSNLFGLDNVRTDEYLGLNNRYEFLLSIPCPTSEEKAEMDSLARQLDRYSSAEVETIKRTLSIIRNAHD